MKKWMPIAMVTIALTGCGNRVPQLSPVVWSPTLLQNTTMGPWSESRFTQYFAKSTIAGFGTLREWDQTKGAVVDVGELCKGRLPTSPVLLSQPTGFPQNVYRGDKVIFFAVPDDNGGVRLHTLCAATGVYAFTEELWRFMLEELRRKEKKELEISAT